MLIAGLGKWVMPDSILKSKKAYTYYLVEGSAEERCLVLAVNWPALVAGGLTGAAAAAAASAVAVVGMPAAYSLMAARRQKEKIKTHYFQPCSTGLPGFSRVLHKQLNPSFSLACSQHSSQSWSPVLSGHTAYNEEPLIYQRNRMKGGGGASLLGRALKMLSVFVRRGYPQSLCVWAVQRHRMPVSQHYLSWP